MSEKVSTKEPSKEPATKQEPRWLDCSKILVFCNMAVFLAMVVSKGSWRACIFPGGDTLLAWGANLGALVVHGQYWRLLSSIFLHAGVMHLALNMYALWTFGPMVSSIFGNKRFLLIYLLSGVAGSLAGIVWDPTLISAGASGALVGLAGAMLAVLITGHLENQKQNLHPGIFFAVVCASLSYGFFMQGIDNAAHIGGLIGGVFFGLVLQPGVLPQDRLGKASALVALSAVLVVVGGSCLAMTALDQRSKTYGLSQDAIKALSEKSYDKSLQLYDQLLRTDLNSAYFVGRAASYIGLKKFQRAVSDCDRALALNPKDLNAYLARARSYHDLGQEKKALKDLDYALQLLPKHAGAYNSRAWTELALGLYQPALKDIDQALALDNSRAEFFDTRGMAYVCLGKFDKAIADFEDGLKINPEEGACFYHLFLVYKAQGKEEMAAKAKVKAEEFHYKPEPWEIGLETASGPKLTTKQP